MAWTLAVIQAGYATVKPYWPDVYLHYYHTLVDVLGQMAVTGIPIYLIAKWYKDKTPRQ